ncbi:uncharacterized protein LOC141901854 [Tubulanus polymorphus]|uniref:uncharacterized protein LOC141901854 n=1 Tax=Tubulanus polymorphus TaxID=672921 RepID=UPI003DA41E37
MSTRIVTKHDTDKILQGAVVLGCGGGGPLLFARKMTEKMQGPAIIQSGCLVSESDWMVMIALIGSPSKVKEKSTPGADSAAKANSSVYSAKSRWKFAIASIRNQKAAKIVRDEIDGLRLADPSHSHRTLPHQGESNFFELVRRVQRLNFFSRWDVGTDEVDGSALISPVVPVTNTFNYIQSQCRMRASDLRNYPRFNGFERFKYVLTGELGVVNIATSLFLSSAFGVTVLDGDGAGRAVPFVNMITYANKLNVSPSTVVSPQQADDLSSVASVTMDLPRGKESLVEELLADLLIDPDGHFTPYVGYGTYVTRGHQLLDIPIWGTYSKAIAVGEALSTCVSHERVDRIIDALATHGIRSKILFRGQVICNVLQDNSARDMGHLTIENQRGNSRMKLWYMNEFMMAIPSDTNVPVAMAPDLIMIVPSVGPPVDLSSIGQIGKTEVYVLGAEASSKIRTTEIIENFEKVYCLFKDDCGKTIYTGSYRQLTFAGS